MQLTLSLDGDVRPKILEAAISLSDQSFPSLTDLPTPLLASARKMVFGEASAPLRPTLTHPRQQGPTVRGHSKPNMDCGVKGC